MRVAVLLLSYERYETLLKTLQSNIANAGCQFDLFVLDQGSKDGNVLSLMKNLMSIGGGVIQFWEVQYLPFNIGIAAGFNLLMKRVALQPDYDYYQFIANDILEPENWLINKIRAIQSIPNSGMVSIPVGDHAFAPVKLGNQWTFPGDVIGQFMISAEVWKKVGAFREEWGHYSPVDIDYNARCRKAGFVNYYINSPRAIHLDDKDRNLYGYNKDEAIARTWPLYGESLKDEDYHIPNGDTNFNAPEYVPEDLPVQS